MKKLLVSITCLFVSVSIAAEEVMIAAAANVSFAMDELIQEFNKDHPDIEVSIIRGSSGKLTAQIMNGAPYNVFLSADMKYPHALWESQHAITQPAKYAEGILVLFSHKPRDLSPGMAILSEQFIKRIASANHRTAPYGKAAHEAIHKAKMSKTIQHKLVFGENIAQTVQFCLAQADIGFVAKSAVFSPHMTRYNKQGVHWIEVDPTLYQPIEQGIVLLRHAADNANARKIYNFFLSQDAKEILRKYGYQ